MQYSILILLPPLTRHSLEHLRTADIGHKVVTGVEGESDPEMSITALGLLQIFAESLYGAE